GAHPATGQAHRRGRARRARRRRRAGRGQHPADHLPRAAARTRPRHDRAPRRLPVHVRRTLPPRRTAAHVPRHPGRRRRHLVHGPDGASGRRGLHGGVATTFVDAAAAGAVGQARGGPARTVSAAVRYLRPALHGPFTVTPEILHDDGRVAVVRTPVLDVEGA